MKIRQLRTEEFEAKMAVSQFAFQIQLTPEKLESLRSTFRPEEDWGVFDEQEELLSKLTIIPFEAWVQGELLAMGGIAGVATWPEARRQGCVKELLIHSLNTMREAGQTISMLHPFEYPFYRKYGWEMTIDYMRYTIEKLRLPSRVETPGQVRRMVNPDIKVLNQVYAQYASRYSGTIVRTEDWWERKVLSKTGIVACYTTEAEQAEGYVFYEVSNRKLTIHDWVSVSETARKALWTYIGNHDSMIDEVIITVPVDDQLPFLLHNPRVKQEIVPYFMSRIVDAEALLGLYSWSAGQSEEEIVLTLTDEYAPWNNGVFRLLWSKEGSARVERMEATAVSTEAVGLADERGVSCDIQTLSAMLLGNRKPAWLQEVGRITGAAESITRLERRIPSRTTHLMDFF